MSHRCTDCPHIVGGATERDCCFPDCVGGYENVTRGLAEKCTKLENQLDHQWVNCVDRLPELNDELVIVYFSESNSVESVHAQDYFSDITDGVDDSGNQIYTKWYLDQSVTHWQPMPPAPKQEME